MAIKNTYYAESWDAIYTAFEKVNFASFDYDSIKEGLLSYMKLYYKESFNDYIESSEAVAIIEMFAYIAEQLSYRIDMNSHEVFITDAERKQSILKLAKLISYTASRNLPARGMVKITSISTTETITDSQGNNLANLTIFWNDPNNSLWKEQFFLVMNRVMAGKFGQPSKVSTVGDVSFQLYTFNNQLSSFTNSVYRYGADTGADNFPMEIVTADLDDNGPFEKAPDVNNQMNVLYSNDGLGDGSDLTGFLLYTKQGLLSLIDYTFDGRIPNRNIDVNLQNINDTDVWVHKVDTSGRITERWVKVDTVNEQNLHFSLDRNRKKFEVETLENDSVKLIFGDGDFSDIPVGRYFIWCRQSANTNSVIQKNTAVNQPMIFTYRSTLGITETSSLTFSLTSSLTNSSLSEDIEHIRQAAPTVYYSQGRMVNGQDYNTFLLRDPRVLHLKTINRTFAGQPKHVEWNDASGQYQNVKLFGDDLQIGYEFRHNAVNTTESGRSLIDNVLEPLLRTPGVINMMIHQTAAMLPGVVSTPRTKFIENGANWMEKTLIQGFIDRHYYGEPDSTTTVNNILYAVVDNDADQHIYLDTLPRIIGGSYVQGSGLQSVSDQPHFGLRFERYIKMFNLTGNITGITANSSLLPQTFTIECAANQTSFTVISSINGRLADAAVGEVYSNGGISFTITNTGAYVQGDTFILDIHAQKVLVESSSFDLSMRNSSDYDLRVFIDSVETTAFSFSTVTDLCTFTVPITIGKTVSFVFERKPYGGNRCNLMGRWYTIIGDNIDDEINSFDPITGGGVNDSSWTIKVDRIFDNAGNALGFTTTYRDLKLVAYSPTTKFWYNTNDQILDSQTKNAVRDKILVLRSNLYTNRVTGALLPLGSNQVYDVVGNVRDSSGVVAPNLLEVMPAGTLDLLVSGTGVTDNVMQFEDFALVDYSYERKIGSKFYPITDTSLQITITGGLTLLTESFAPGSFTVTDTATGALYRRYLTRKSLDFMWQHFSPYTNLIDPATTNIHDAYLLTRGYYDEVTAYLNNITTTVPTPPTPLVLRNTFGMLLNNKMMSDTMILHSAKIKLLFGQKASPELRAKFTVVMTPSASLTNDQVKAEILDVITNHFSIANWTFGSTFYATELISLIHQRLPADIASVVIVPLYVNNSFGSMFVVESGVDEILQSCAQLSDIEIVSTLTSAIIRQSV